MAMMAVVASTPTNVGKHIVMTRLHDLDAKKRGNREPLSERRTNRPTDRPRGTDGRTDGRIKRETTRESVQIVINAE